MALVLFDWDDTIATDPGPSDFGRITEDGVEAGRRLHAAYHTLAVVSNQGARMEKMRGLRSVECLRDFMSHDLSNWGEGDDIWKQWVFLCPHPRLDNCSCRKPRPDLLSAAMAKFLVDYGRAERTWMVGDKWSDILAGHRVGAETILVNSPYPYVKRGTTPVEDAPPPRFRVNNVVDAADIIIGLERVWGEKNASKGKDS